MMSVDNLKIHNLPVILVSAVDEVAAKAIIADIIDDEPPREDKEGVCCCRLWRISNKYYTMDVHLHPVTDAPAPAERRPPSAPQAHIIYLTESEVSEEVAEKRAEAAVLARGAVRLALCPAPAPGALRAWALRRRYELVPLPAATPAPPPPGPFPELRGVERARAALHAHHWAPTESGELGSDSSSGGSGSESDADAEGCEADVERFGLALRLAAAARGALAHTAAREEQLARAESLALALSRALRPSRRDPDPGSGPAPV